MTTYTAHFQGEAWVGGQAMPVDDSELKWDCTAFAQANAAYVAALPDDHGLGVADNDDVFKHDPAAPDLVRRWNGPFTIRITAS